jgi:hypothetical protein
MSPGRTGFHPSSWRISEPHGADLSQHMREMLDRLTTVTTAR